MADHNERLPEERAEESQALIEELRRRYQPDAEDRASLAHIRARLLSGASSDKREPLPLAPRLLSQKQGRTDSMNENLNGNGLGARERSSWGRRVSLIAAALLVAVLVGSLVTLLSLARHNVTGRQSVQHPHQQSAISNLHMIDQASGWAVGEKGLVLRTTDGGVHWQDVSPQNIPQTTLWAGRDWLPDALNAWITFTLNKDGTGYYRPADVSYIYHTSDGGRHWQRTILHTNGYMVGSLTFSDPLHGWLLTFHESAIHVVTGPEPVDPPDLYRTTDGGKTWLKVLNAHEQAAKLFTNVYAGGISFVHARTGFLAGDVSAMTSMPVLYITQDGGAHWQPFWSPATQASNPAIVPSANLNPTRIWAPSFFNTHDGVMPVAFEGNSTMRLYTTHDGGATWQAGSPLHVQLTGPNQRLHGFIAPPVVLDAKHVWVALNMGVDRPTRVVYATNDAGQHWSQVIMHSDPESNSSMAPRFTSPLVGWQLTYINGPDETQFSVLYKTTDGGRTWTQVHAHFPSYVVPKSAY